MVVATPLVLHQASEVPPLARGAFQAALQGTVVAGAHARACDSAVVRARVLANAGSNCESSRPRESAERQSAHSP